MNELDIFSNALKIASADERSQYLDQACGDDVELRQRLDDLLRSHSDVRSFMVALAPGIGANIDEPICEKPSTAADDLFERFDDELSLESTCTCIDLHRRGVRQ